MSLKSIFILLFLSCSFSESLIIHHAGFQTYSGEYYGSQARIGTWGVLDMNPNSTYQVSIILLADNNGCKSYVKAGLHVFPLVYNDAKLRFFVEWSDDADKGTGCYNTLCPGFVVNDTSKLYAGSPIAPTSEYNGKDYFLAIRISKEPVTNLWTVYREEVDGSGSSRLGWWEAGVFGDLLNSATSVQWIGFVDYEDNEAGPAMGSGHFPEEGKKKAAYFQNLQLFDKAGNGYSSPKVSDLAKAVDKPDCYRVIGASSAALGEDDDHKFYYGGPAGCTN